MGWSDSVHKSRVSSSFIEVLHLHAQRKKDEPRSSVIWKRSRASLLICAAALLLISRKLKPFRSPKTSNEQDVIQLSSGKLTDLITALDSLKGPGQVILDLCGKLFKGSLSGSDPHRLLLDASSNGVRLRNGAIELPAGSCLVVTGKDISMDNVYLSQATEADEAEGKSKSKPEALLLVSGGSLLMESCSIGEMPMYCIPLVVDGSATVQLTGCNISVESFPEGTKAPPSEGGLAQSTHAILVRGSGSMLVADEASTFTSGGGCGLCVTSGGCAELSGGCVLSGATHGLAVSGEGSQAVVEGCSVEDCEASSISASAASRVSLTNTSVSGTSASGLEVREGACVVAKYCTLTGCAEDCLLITQGGVVDMDGCSMSGSLTGCGATLGGEGSELTASNCTFEGNAACNTQVETGATLTLAGCMLSGALQYHGLSVSGDGTKVAARKCTFNSNELCNVHLDRGASVEFVECSMSDSKKFTGMAVGGRGCQVSAVDCVFDSNMKSNVSVYAGASVDLIGCKMRRAQELHGLVVKDQGSVVTAMDCSLECNEEVNVLVSDGATVELTSCIMCSSRSAKGLVVKGAGSGVIANGCTFQANDEANVFVSAGAEATLEGCSLSGAKRLHGLVVSDPGSWVRAKECSFTKNAHIGVLAMAGGRMELLACSVFDNGESAAVAEDEGSQLTMDAATELDQKADSMYGGSVVHC